jgi:hypothetical protein
MAIFLLSKLFFFRLVSHVKERSTASGKNGGSSGSVACQ